MKKNKYKINFCPSVLFCQIAAGSTEICKAFYQADGSDSKAERQQTNAAMDLKSCYLQKK